MTGPAKDGPCIAITHDYLTQRGGAERVVLSLLRAFPEATIYTTLYEPEGTYPEFKDARIVVSPLDQVDFLRQHHRYAFPLLPFAAAALKVDADVVIASSSGWAHGFSYAPKTSVIVYCHNPARWLYQTTTYLGQSARRSAAGLVLLAIRPLLIAWDKKAAHRSHVYLANSHVVRDRIRKAYGLEAKVVPPPHGMDPSLPSEPIPAIEGWARRGGYYLIVSRLLPYKNVHQAIEAFHGLSERLLVVGSGPMADTLREGLPPNIQLLSELNDAQMRYAYTHATALVAPSYEDFGLTPLEAGSYGKPTLALRGGGYLDTIRPGLNGMFFDSPTPPAIRAAVHANRARKWNPSAIRAHVESFSEARFHAEIRRQVARQVTLASTNPALMEEDQTPVHTAHLHQVPAAELAT